MKDKDPGYSRSKYEQAKRELDLGDQEMVDEFMGRVGQLVHQEADPTTPEAVERITRQVTEEMPQHRKVVDRLTQIYDEES